MRYKAGDKVKIRADLVDGRIYGTRSTNYKGEMSKWYGKILTITKDNNDSYSTKEDKGMWGWTDEMIEGYAEEPQWRLPTIQELLTLVNYEKADPACDLENTVSSGYWSCTASADYTNYIWVVFFSSGYSSYYHKENLTYVRCVKEHPDGSLEWSDSSRKPMNWDEAFIYAEAMNKSNI